MSDSSKFFERMRQIDIASRPVFSMFEQTMLKKITFFIFVLNMNSLCGLTLHNNDQSAKTV